MRLIRPDIKSPPTSLTPYFLLPLRPSPSLRAFQTYGLFTSGIGVHYAPSAITSPTHQHLASNLIIGERLIPQIVLRGADRRPFEIQDLCPSDSRFKILVFAGLGEPVAPGAANAKGTRAKVQAERTYGRVEHVEALAKGMEGDEKGWYQGMGRKARKGTEMFDVLVVCMGKKETFAHTAVPEAFRTHWSKCVITSFFLFLVSLFLR